MSDFPDGDEEGQRFAQLLDSLELAKDVDAKIAALGRLESDLPSFLTLSDPDRVIQLLKPLLKHPHAQLSNAAINFCHAFFPILRSNNSPHASHTPTAKMAVSSLMPAILERSGDGRERTREAAARALEELGRVAIDCTRNPLAGSVGASSHRAKDQDTPLFQFEKCAREAGLGSKSAKIREQVCKVLPLLRSYNNRFPVKTFLTPLVELLADADPFCREGSKAALVSLFSKAPPGAKSDLKKELEKQNIRKPLADSILKDVLSSTSPQTASTPSSEFLTLPSEDNVRSPSSSLPPTRPGTSMAAAAAASEENVQPVYIASKLDLDRTFNSMLPCFQDKETEHNWQARENAIIKMRGMLRAGVYESYQAAFPPAIKNLQDGILKGVSSLRTTLATQGISLITELAARLGDDLDPCVDTFVPALLKMAGFTKRIVATSSQAAVKSIFQNVSYRHRFMELLWSFMTDKTVATRVSMVEHLQTLLLTHAQHRKHALEHHDGLAVIDKILKKGLADQNPEVRARSREAFFTYQAHWSSRANALMDTLDSTAKKQLSGAGSKISAPSPLKSTFRSVDDPVRRAGGPSSAILAAKRAASARMAQERRQGSGTIDSEGEAALPATPKAAPSTALKARSASTSKPRPASVLAASTPSSIPSPSSPPSASSSVSKATGASSYDTHAQQQSRSRATSIASSQSSGGASKGSAASGQSPSNRLTTPADRLSLRHFSGSGAGPSAGTTALSAHSLKARSVADLGQGQHANREQGPFGPQGSSAAPPSKSRFAALSNPDDTVQLDATGSSEADATLDLMGNTSALRAEYGGDDSVTFLGPIRHGNNNAAGDHHHENGDDTTAADDDGDGDDDRSTSTPRQLLSNTILPKNSGISRDEPVEFSAPGLAFRTPQPAQPAAFRGGSGWFMDRAERLDNGPISPLKSKPDAVEWVSEIRSGKADVKIFRMVAKLCTQFKITASPGSLNGDGSTTTDGDDDEPQLEAGKPTTDVFGSVGRKTLQAEASGLDENENGEDDASATKQMEAWRDGQLFDRLWDSLKYFLLQTTTKSTSTDRLTAALILLHKLIENQHPLFVSFGLEEDLLEVILKFRLQTTDLPFATSSCEAIIDSWASKTNPALGLSNLSTISTQLLLLRSDPDTATHSSSNQGEAQGQVKAQTLALRAVSKILSRLPPEVIEEELSKPMLKEWITQAFTDTSNVKLRQAAVQVLICANIKLQNPEAVFDLVGPLEQTQKDLLTYYFAKEHQ